MRKITVIFFVLLGIAVLAGGCAADTDSADTAATTTTTEAAVTETESAATEETNKAFDKIKVQVNDDYYYKVPGDFEEIEADFGEAFQNPRLFVSDDGNVRIRSFVYVDEGCLFPDVVEAIYEGRDAEIGYQLLRGQDTPAAHVLHQETDASGAEMYVTSFLWPDGSNELCLVEIFSPGKEQEELAEEIFDSITNPADVAGVQQPDGDTPSDEEMNDILMHDAQDAAQEQWEQDLHDEYYQDWPYHF